MDDRGRVRGAVEWLRFRASNIRGRTSAVAARTSAATATGSIWRRSKQPAPLQMDTPQGTAPAAAPVAPATPQEEADFKAFAAVPQNDVDKRIPLAESFLQKYPQSQYRPAMYQTLVSGYLAKQEVPKMIDAGEKEIALNPNDTPILGIDGADAGAYAESEGAGCTGAAEQGGVVFKARN